MKFELEVYHRDTPDEELLNDVRTVAKKLSKNTVTMREYEQNGRFHPSTLQRRFGSWFKVLEMCSLEPSRSKLNISNEDLFKNLESIWLNLGHQPRYNEIKKPVSLYSAGTYEKRFGTYRKALEAFIGFINEDNNETANSEYFNVSNDVFSENGIKHTTKREISDRLRFRVLMRDGFCCQSCGASPATTRGVELHVDHIMPWSKGGETIVENLQTKCQQCNLGKGNAFSM